MTLATQAKILRLLQDGDSNASAATRRSTTNVRIIAATNRKLEELDGRQERSARTCITG